MKKKIEMAMFRKNLQRATVTKSTKRLLDIAANY